MTIILTILLVSAEFITKVRLELVFQGETFKRAFWWSHTRKREIFINFRSVLVSFNEELAGLYGGVLQRQTKFAAASISKILSLYKSNKYTKTVPTSVILIGHSMVRIHPYSTVYGYYLSINLMLCCEIPYLLSFDVLF